jgi:hypothetical protein
LFEILTVPLNHTETNYGDVTIAKEWIWQQRECTLVIFKHLTI